MYSNYYIRDASGNVMATYKANIDTVAESTVYTVDERNLYGSDRLGMYAYPDTVYPVPAASTADFQPIWHGYRKYELKNHLGNVMTVVNGHKIALDDDQDGEIDGFTAQIEAAYDYSPSTTKESSVWIGVIRKSFEPNYTAGTSGETNPLAPDFMWCMDGDGTEKFGSGHDATLYNTTNVQDRDANAASALRTAGNTSSYMKIADDADFDFGSSDFTVSIWVKKLVGNSSWNHAVAVAKWKTGGQLQNCEWYLNISNGASGTNNASQFTIVAGTTRYDINGPVLTIGNWTHLVGVREGNYIRFYIDGASVGSTYVGNATINNVTGTDLLIAKTGNNNYLKAEFDEFAVYHRALDATEVSDLYNSGCADMDATVGEMAEGGYRYGFNGMERDDEIKGKGNSVNYKARIFDPRLGRFLSIDPLTMKFPYYSPYQFAGNMPLLAIDLDGKEEFFYMDALKDKTFGVAKDLMISTDVGIEAYMSIWNSGEKPIAQDVYFVVTDFSQKNVNYFGTKTANAKTFNFNSEALHDDGSIVETFSNKLMVEQYELGDIDFSHSKENGNNISVIFINSNSDSYKQAKSGSSDGIRFLSETIYHELKAHVIPQVGKTEIDNSPTKGKEEHQSYHGDYSNYSPAKDAETPGTPRQEYIDQAKAVQNESPNQNESPKK